MANFKKNIWDNILAKGHESYDFAMDECLLSLLKEPSLKSKTYLSNEDALKLLKKYKKEQDVKYLNEILEGNIKLMLHLCMKSWIPGMYISDLFQEACMGFLKGIEKYDEEKAVTRDGKTKISSFAFFYAKKYVLMYIETNSSSIRFTRRPLRAAQKIKKLIEAAVKEFEVNECHIPYEYMLDSSSRMEIQGAIDINSPLVSLSSPIGDGDSSEIYVEDTISDKNSFVVELDNAMDIELLYEIINDLNTKTQRLLLAKFAISDEEFISVCNDYNISDTEGNEFVNQTISHLKKSLK